jgi:hypothetical protein
MHEVEQVETELTTARPTVEQSLEYKMAILAEKDISENVSKAIKSNKAHRRWFWELLQNAKDTVVDEPERQVSIKLTYSKTDGNTPTIKFEHSGNPFKFTTDPTRFDDLTNLILPLSGKSAGRTTGKFGTGFLSTHILSLKIRVEGVYMNEVGEYSDFNIIIDRSETDRTRLIASIVKSLTEQKLSFKKISDNSYTPNKSDFRTTKFTYFLECNKNGADYAFEIVEEGIKDLLQTLPYVLNFVPEIDTVEVIDKELSKSRTVFKKSKEEQLNDLKVSTISKMVWNLEDVKTDEKNILISSMTDGEVEIAIEVSIGNGSYIVSDFKSKYQKQTEKEFPTLFSSFPLIGSEDFKFPLLINSKHFNPNETRDGVELKTNTDGNQLLIDKSVILYHKFLDNASKDWKDIFILALTDDSVSPNHDWINKKWFEQGTNEFQGVLKPIRGKILITPLVDILTDENKAERKTIKAANNSNQIFFPLKENKNKLHEFGKVIFPNSLPVLSDVDNWCSVVWNEKDFERLNIEFIIQGIASKQSVGAVAELLYKDNSKTDETLTWLYNFCNFIKTDFKDKTTLLFNHTVNNIPFKFIPDRDLNFALLNYLKKDIGYKGLGTIDETLLTIHSEITGDNLKSRLLHSKFSSFLPTSEMLTEEQVAYTIREAMENRLKKDDDHSVAFKNSLSKLYDWISIKANDDKEYFKEALKNRMLSAIIPSEKMKFVTKILELDRNKKISLERQVEILSLPNLERIIELGKEALEAEQQEQADFDFKNMIGVHIENLVRERIKNDIAKFSISTVKEKQGGQDIVVMIDNEVIYYIEVKSRWDNNKSIIMSNAQIKRATKNKLTYSLCCVEMCDYRPADGSRHHVNDISIILNRIKFIKDIGHRLEPLISNALSVEAIEDEIKLTDEYRAVVPQPMINREGISFDNFVDYLIEVLKLN